ncbi:hypothetical protein H9P43_008444 [Blastocladiella emersonii ATCC 22665]|nr:hypothetical protein H9P43_008444 [Blastocladiella emersonii ATCC 22665]
MDSAPPASAAPGDSPQRTSWLTLDTVLPLVAADATNEEKIAGLLALPQVLDAREAGDVRRLHAALDFRYIRRLLKAKKGEDQAALQSVALNVLSVLAGDHEVALSAELGSCLLLAVQLLAGSPDATVRADALDVVQRMAGHGDRDTAVALLAAPGLLVDAFLLMPDDRRDAFRSFLVALSDHAGARVHPVLGLLNQLRSRLESTANPDGRAHQLALLDTLTALLEHLESASGSPRQRRPATPAAGKDDAMEVDSDDESDDEADDESAPSLDLKTLLPLLLRTRGAPVLLTRRALRLAAAWLAVWRGAAAACDATTWTVLANAAAVDLQLALDALDPMSVPGGDSQEAASIAAACWVIERLVDALVRDHVSLAGPALLAWRRHTGDLVLALAAYLEPFASEIGAGNRKDPFDALVVALARLTCQLVCEADDDAETPDAVLAVLPLLVYLATDPHAPAAAAPWAAACLARVSADETVAADLRARHARSKVAARLAAPQVWAVQPGPPPRVDWDTATHLASTLLNGLLLHPGSAEEGGAAVMAEVAAIVCRADVPRAVRTMLGRRAGSAASPTAAARAVAAADAAGQALGTVAAYATMAASRSPSPLAGDAPRKIADLVLAFLGAAWRSGAGESLGDLVALVLDGTAAVAGASREAAAGWRSAVEAAKMDGGALAKVRVPRGGEVGGVVKVLGLLD